MGDMNQIRNIVILTGAGISAESGIDTFRSGGGLWEQHRVEDVATPEAFAHDPNLVHRFYDARRAAIQEKEPNAAHFALARLEAEWPGELLLVTQNVDDLHERGGAARVLHMHGEHLKAWCTSCDVRSLWRGPLLASRCGLVRRDALPDGRDLRRAARGGPVRLDRHLGRGLSGGRLRPERARTGRTDA